jgi:hypothetical protein
VGRDTSQAPRGENVGLRSRVWRSRARYGNVLSPAAVAVPFRLFRGGRMLVSARIEDPSRRWTSQPLTLLLDTGASGCVLFDDAVETRVRPMPTWPRLEGVRVRTVLGESRAAVSVVPRVVLTEASPPLAEDRVETGTQARASLPDLQGELPDPVHGLLGTTFLARFRLILDYADEVLWLERSRAPRSGGARRAQVGLGLIRQWNQVCVAEVAPASPAAASDIAFGDVLISIDGTPVADLDAPSAERRLEGEPGSTVVLVVKRGGMQRVLKLTRRP